MCHRRACQRTRATRHSPTAILSVSSLRGRRADMCHRTRVSVRTRDTCRTLSGLTWALVTHPLHTRAPCRRRPPAKHACKDKHPHRPHS